MIDQTIKQYKIKKLLGRGGMGEVYLAEDTKLRRPVAFKVLKPELTADSDRQRRFIQEARAAAAVVHPAIAQIYDVDEDQGLTYIVMEYVEGKTLSQLISGHELDLIGSIEIALQICDGLSRAHKANIVHRDIKSDNIMVTLDGHAKLLDFGLAKLLTPKAGDQDETKTMDIERTATLARTTPGMVMGTLAYMSPEQARGLEINQSSDIFSLGIVIYEMVTGELPFKGLTPLDTMHNIAYEEARPVTIVRKNLPPQLHRIISRCLRKRSEDRYQNAHELYNDLKHLKHDIDSGIRRPLSARERLQEVMDWTKSSLPFGTKGILALTIAVGLIITAIFVRIPWASLIIFALIGLYIYRYIRNRKNRMLKRFVQKMSGYKEVTAISIRGDQVIVFVEKAQAKLYIRTNDLIDTVNQKLFVGNPVEVTIRDGIESEELQKALREPGIVYVREGVAGGS